MLYHLSSEQQYCLSNISSSDETTIVKYIDQKVAIDTLFYHIIDQLLEGKSVQIICNEQGLKNELHSKLANEGLSDYMIETGINRISDRKISTLRANIKSKSKYKDFREQRLRLTFQLNEINAKYANLNTSIINDITLNELPVVLSRKNASPCISSIKYTQIDSSNHRDTLKVIHELSKNYNPLYEELTRSEILNKKVRETLVNIESIEKLRDKVLDFIRLNEELSIEYNDIKDKYLSISDSNNENKYNILYDFLKQQIIKASFISENEEENERFSLFKKKTIKTAQTVGKQLFEINTKLKNLDTDLTKHLLENLTTKSELEQYLHLLLNKVMKEKKSSSDIGEDITKHLSLLNQQDEKWKKAALELDNQIQELNKINLLDKCIENNSKGLQQQISTLTKINTILHRIVYRLESHSDFYLFQARIVDSDEKQKIIETLKHLPQNDWVTTYDFATFLNIKKKYIKVNLPNKVNKPYHLLNQYRASLDEKISDVINRIKLTQKSTIEHLTKSNKELFQSLIKKKLPFDLTTSELNSQHFEVSKKLFPIQLNSMAIKGYDVSYLLGETDQVVDDVIVHCVPFSEEDFNGISQEKNYSPLYLNHYQYTNKIDQLSNTDKIKAAKKLAKLVLSTNPSIKIYQLRSANIISLLPFEDNQILEDILIQNGSKVMDLDDIYNRLVESLLTTERRQHIVIKDGLLKSNNTEALSFQLEILKHLETAGVQVSSIYTIDQLNTDISQPINILCQQILETTDVTTIVVDSSKQTMEKVEQKQENELIDTKQ